MFLVLNTQVSLYNLEWGQAQSFHQAMGSGQTWVALFCVIVSMITSTFCFPQAILHFHLW